MIHDLYTISYPSYNNVSTSSDWVVHLHPLCLVAVQDTVHDSFVLPAQLSIRLHPTFHHIRGRRRHPGNRS